MNKLMEQLESCRYEINDTTLVNTLAFIDAEHSIVLNDRLGLIGEFEDEQEQADWRKRESGLRERWDFFRDSEVAYVVSIRRTGKRGTSYSVIGENGMLAIPYKVTHTFIIDGEDKDINNPYGYVFIVKGRSVEDFFDGIKPMAVILYADGRIETNYRDIRYEQEAMGYSIRYTEDLEIDKIGSSSGAYKVLLENGGYMSYNINEINRIYGLRALKYKSMNIERRVGTDEFE